MNVPVPKASVKELHSFVGMAVIGAGRDERGPGAAVATVAEAAVAAIARPVVAEVLWSLIDEVKKVKGADATDVIGIVANLLADRAYEFHPDA